MKAPGAVIMGLKTFMIPTQRPNRGLLQTRMVLGLPGRERRFRGRRLPDRPAHRANRTGNADQRQSRAFKRRLLAVL